MTINVLIRGVWIVFFTEIHYNYFYKHNGSFKPWIGNWLGFV